jgi:uncharacterized membrane protein YdjX (TVP38/TMEM64 family)
MHIVKKLLIVFIIIASFVIIYRLLKQNSEVKEQIDKQIMEVKKEGFVAQVNDPAIPAIPMELLLFAAIIPATEVP